MKNFKIKFLSLTIMLMIALISINSNATEECFEKTSRAIFKFNMGFDDLVLEPIAKGYDKLPNPVKKGTSNFTSNISTD